MPIYASLLVVTIVQDQVGTLESSHRQIDLGAGPYNEQSYCTIQVEYCSQALIIFDFI